MAGREANQNETAEPSEGIQLQPENAPGWLKELLSRSLGNVIRIGDYLSATQYCLGKLHSDAQFKEDCFENLVSNVQTALDKKLIREQLQRFLDKEGPDFLITFELATSQLWTALEAFAVDAVVQLLVHERFAWECEEIKKIKVSIAEYRTLDDESRAEHVVHAVDRSPRARGVGRFKSLWNGVGASFPTIGEEQKKTILELQQVRNVIVHRNGIVDRHLLDQCPWLKTPITIGKPLRLERRRFSGPPGLYAPGHPSYMDASLRLIRDMAQCMSDFAAENG